MTVYPVSENEIHDRAAAVTTKGWPTYIISKKVILSWYQRKGPHAGIAQTPGVRKQTEVKVTATNYSMEWGKAIENHLRQQVRET